MKNVKLQHKVIFLLILTFGGIFGYILFPEIHVKNTFTLEEDNPSKSANEYILPGPISDHLWSPDGTKIAYIKPPPGQIWNSELWIADKSPNSAELINHQLIYTGAEGHREYGLQDWKDDWLLIMIRFEEGTPSTYYGRNEIWKIKTDGTGLTQLTFTETNGIRTTWSNPSYTNRGTAGWANFIPGTNKIYFKAHNGNGWWKSFICNDDGTDGWYHISNPDYAFYCNMAPIGDKFLWGDASYWNDPTTLSVSNMDGSERLTIKSFSYSLAAYGHQSTILADGSTFIWQYNDNIYAIGMDGTNERTVLDDIYINQVWNYNPANPQEFIMASTRLDGNMHLFKMNVDGSDIVPLTEAGPYLDERPILSGDGNYLSYRRLPYNFDTDDPQPWPYDLVVKSLIPSPIITLNTPESDDFYSSTSPNYDISISGEYDKIWYTLDNGITNISINDLTGTIDQTEWDKLTDGLLTLRFYANNSLGKLGYSEVTIYKDTVFPSIILNSPLPYELFGKAAPSYDLSIVESNLDLMWYTLDGGITNITFYELTGMIEQTEWDKMGNGTVTLIFYVKDEAGNHNSTYLIVRKEATPPLITIISPESNEIFNSIAPTFEVSIEETDLDSTWYSLDDGITNILFTGLTGTIDQSEWNKIESGIVNLKFYANDSYGFQSFEEVVIEKDVDAPLIIINSPQEDDIFSSTAPTFDITVIDSHLDSMWYTIDNGITNIDIFSMTGTIDQTEWDKKSGGNVPIRFYAMDIFGYTAYSEVIVIKDVVNPTITINSPSNFEVYGYSPPSFSLSIVEPNLDSMWYSLDNGITNIGITSFSGTIDQSEWNKKATGTVTIQFYASDEAGNIGVSQVVVHKDISIPLIAIMYPEVNDFSGFEAPYFELAIVEPNIDLMWYSLDFGLTNIYFNDLTGYIDQTEWGKYGNGSVVIQFHVKDKGGNEAFSEVLINKDIYEPIIAIEIPELGDQFLNYAPIYSISIQEPNLAEFWYSLDNGITNLTISELTGLIDQQEWDTLPDGHVTIQFYAKDKAGNVGINSTIVFKLSSDKELPPAISGYDIFLLIGLMSMISIVLIKIRRKS